MFQPKMESRLFHAHAIINDVYNARALIDNGSGCYATVNPRVVQRMKLTTTPISSRPIGGVFEKGTRAVTEVAKFSFDIGGHATHNAFAYVLPGQHEDILLGRPWLHHQMAVIDESAKHLTFKMSGVRVYDTETHDTYDVAAKTLRVSQLSGAHYAAMAERARQKPQGGLRVFSVTMKDIDQALKPKTKPSIEEIEENLPRHYRDFLSVFDPREANALPPHRPGIDHEIPIENDEKGKPKELPWGPLYGMSREQLLVLRKTLTELLDNGFIRVSKSSAAAPVLFVRKPGGGLRFCVDYRALNEITKKDRYPLPLIRETLMALGRAKWLTKLDVSAAFHKIRIAKGEEWKTAFRTRYGLYEWLVTPFGLTGAPATFQRYINHVLREYLDDFCTAYIDDILIFTDGSLAHHRECVRKVLGKLQDAGLQLDFTKCEFETKGVKYLGYVINVGNGLQMDPDKVQAIKEWKAPRSQKGVRSFLGFANYYRDFINNYSDTALPLTTLTKKDTPFRWGDAEQAAFDLLKRRFVEEPILATLDPERDTRIEPDASGWSTGGALMQRDDDGFWHPCAYHSEKHAPAECNYDIHDKEMLAIIKCLKRWKPELLTLAKPFVILTDHKNLEPFMSKRALTERQVRWSQILSKFNLRLEFRPGSQATIPDALSRREQDRPKDAEDDRIAERHRVLLPETLFLHPVTSNEDTPTPPFENERLRELWHEAFRTQAGDLYRAARNAIRRGDRRFPPELELHMSISECDVHQDYLRFRERTWLPGHEPLTTKVIQTTHDAAVSGHPGRDTTIALVSRQFFWPGCGQDIRKFVRNCGVCGRTTVWRDKKNAMLRPLPIPERIWQEISMDHITALPESNGCTNLLVITDRLGKGSILLPVPADRFTAEGTAELFLEHYVGQHWLPRGMVSDRGVQWVNAFWKHACRRLNIQQRLSTAYHPETDGSTERRNQEVERYLRTFTTYMQNDWAKMLPVAQLALNNRPAASTGISPFFLSHGYDITPVELHHEAPENVNPRHPRAAAEDTVQKLKDAYNWAQAAMATAQEQQERTANRHRQPAPAYRQGDKVWLNLKNISTDRPSKKLDWLHAKYTVTKAISPHTYELDVPRGIHNRFHSTLLRPAAEDPLPSQELDDADPPAMLNDDNDPVWDVDEILCARWKGQGRNRIRQVLVKWTGYLEPTWEPLEELQDTEAMDKFKELYGDPGTNDGPLHSYQPTTRRNRTRRT